MNSSPPRVRVLGVLAGGAGRRMGGRDKAELRVPGRGQTLLQRWAELGLRLGLEVVVVGGKPRSFLPTLRDAPAGAGPLGGLSSLLAHAAPDAAIAVACDMPYVSPELLRRLVARHSSAPVVAPRDAPSGKWHPLFARYDSARVAPALARTLAAGGRSFQQLFSRLTVAELSLSSAEWQQLRDWDRPADLEP